MPSKQKQLGGLTWLYVTGAGFAISLAAAILLMALAIVAGIWLWKLIDPTPL